MKQNNLLCETLMYSFIQSMWEAAPYITNTKLAQYE